MTDASAGQYDGDRPARMAMRRTLTIPGKERGTALPAAAFTQTQASAIPEPERVVAAKSSLADEFAPVIAALRVR